MPKSLKRAELSYTGEAFAQWVKGLRPKLAVTVIKRSDAIDGLTLHRPATPLDRGTHLLLAVGITEDEGRGAKWVL